MITLQPLFINGTAGKLFANYYRPLSEIPPQKAVLHIPAFAEEMNKSRRMVAMQARELARCGYAVLVIDLFGTGDSEGDFSEATWAIWQQDLHIAYAWLKHQEIPFIELWSLRTGALLAMDFIANSSLHCSRLLCWHPVLQGETFVVQLLRLRIASSMLNKNVAPEKTSALKQQIMDMQTLEIAGYRLHPELLKPLMSLSASKIPLPPALQVALFELVNNSEKTSAPVLTQFASALQLQGQQVTINTVKGSQFWATQEITEAPELISATLASLS